MKRWIISSIIVVLLFYIFLYPMMATSIISEVQGFKAKEVQYSRDVLPQERKTEIVTVAFQKLLENRNMTSYYYVAVDTNHIGNLSNDEKNSILYNVKSIHRRPLNCSYKELKQFGLISPFTGIRGDGICIMASSIEFIDNEEAILEVSSITYFYSGEGLKLKLKYGDGKWAVESIISTFTS